MSCFHWFKQLPHTISVRQMKGSVVSHRGSSAMRDGRTPETWSAVDLRNSQVIATTMFCTRRLAAAHATKAVGIKPVASNGHNLIVTIILTGECGLSLLYSER